MQEWVKKPICGCSVLLHLTCLTVWPALLGREKHSWGWRLLGQRKHFYKTTHTSSFSSLLLFVIARGWKNKYLQWAVRHCWNFCRDVWYVNIFLQEFQQRISTTGCGGNIKLECIITVLLVIMLRKDLIPPAPMRHGAWSDSHNVVSLPHTHTHI